jgi:hypothetical protein
MRRVGLEKLHAQLLIERDTVESKTAAARIGLSIERLRGEWKGFASVRAS